MLVRWCRFCYDVDKFLSALDILIPDFYVYSRGRPPKHSPREYLKLIILKEYLKASLRDADIFISNYLLGYRVPWTVIHYWEKKFDRDVIEGLVKHVGGILDDEVGYEYSVIDSTKFSLWSRDTMEFHILARKNRYTLYPVSVGFGSDFKTHLRTLVDGKGFLFADRWYEYEEFIRSVYRHGYKPVIKPNIWRVEGYWRNKARDEYDDELYKRRSVGEGLFGILSNWFGDRVKTMLRETTLTRIGARIIVYQVRIYMREENKGIIEIEITCIIAMIHIKIGKTFLEHAHQM